MERGPASFETSSGLPKYVTEGIDAVRRSGMAAMLERPAVIEAAGFLGFGPIARWIREHPSEYARAAYRDLILAGGGCGPRRKD